MALDGPEEDGVVAVEDGAAAEAEICSNLPFCISWKIIDCANNKGIF